MKKAFLFLAVFSIALVLIFSMVSCTDDLSVSNTSENTNNTNSSTPESEPVESVSVDPLDFMRTKSIRFDKVLVDNYNLSDLTIKVNGTPITYGEDIVFTADAPSVTIEGSFDGTLRVYILICDAGSDNVQSASAGNYTNLDNLQRVIAGYAARLSIENKGLSKMYISISNKTSDGWTKNLSELMDQTFAVYDNASKVE